MGTKLVEAGCHWDEAMTILESSWCNVMLFFPVQVLLSFEPSAGGSVNEKENKPVKVLIRCCHFVMKLGE